MHLVQILLPLCDPDGKRFAGSAFDMVAKELSERFGGVTLYARSPATGLWKKRAGQSARDEVVVCEVMVATLEVRWWKRYRHRLELVFMQDELIVRSQHIRRL
jgi:hypothetical protein